MTSKCKNCGKFLPADATDDTCVACATAAAIEAAQKVAQSTANATSAVGAQSTSVFKFEVPPYHAGQCGGIQTWLRQVEIRMKLAKITSELEKYEYLVASLPVDIISRVHDLIDNQPTLNPYSVLVERIRTEFQPSDAEQIQRLLGGMKRGDKKPSHFLREMRDLARDRLSDIVLKELFLAQLPESITEILSVVEPKDLDSAAAGADRVWERERRDGVAATGIQQGSVKAPSETDTKIDALMGKMVEVLDHLSKRNNRESDPRSSRNRATADQANSHRARNRSRSARRNPNWKLCQAHFKYGDKARTCKNWCERWGGNLASSGNA